MLAIAEASVTRVLMTLVSYWPKKEVSGILIFTLLSDPANLLLEVAVATLMVKSLERPSDEYFSTLRAKVSPWIVKGSSSEIRSAEARSAAVEMPLRVL